MGFGGILAAMAQGLGTGIVKNVEQGWKEDETNKLLNWKTEESDKQRAFDAEESEKKRQHDFALEDRKSRNAISEAAAKASIAARYARSGDGGSGMGDAQKGLTGAIQTLGIYDNQLNSLSEKMAATEDKSQKEALAKQIDFLSNERANYLKQAETISAFKRADQMGRALYATSGGDMDLFSPKAKSTTTDLAVTTIADPKRNVIDTDTMSVSQAQQLADQKREEQGRLRFQKASAEAKDWAAKRNQYTQSTFIPRTF